MPEGMKPDARVDGARTGRSHGPDARRPADEQASPTARQQRDLFTRDEGETGIVLSGVLEHVVYSNDSSFFTVARLFPDDPMQAGPTESTITIAGKLYGVKEGTPLRLVGEWGNHPKYGRQFTVKSYQAKVPETVKGLSRYLASGLVPGLGPELARRLVDHFGHDTLDVMSQTPERLTEVSGIGATRASRIATAWSKARGMQDVLVFLNTYGVTGARANRIVERYGHDAVALIRKNPYRLALDVWGIGFKIADAIAQNLGLSTDAPERLEAGLVHAVGKLAEDGHVHAPEAQLLDAAVKLLETDRARLPPVVDRLVDSELLIRENLGDRGPCVSLARMWQAENDAALAFAELVTSPMRPLRFDIDRAMIEFEREASVSLAAAQRKAIEAALVDKCVVITGGPGVGKTTIVRAIVNILSEEGRSFALAAPTGRAAKRLAESTGQEAMTLHRLLEFQPVHGDFARNAEQPLECDALIVDEASMIDVELFRALVVALQPSAQLVLVGDVDQLPSVGPGSVLGDVIASRAATVVRLTEIFRQAARSDIVTAAHAINQGIVPALEPPPGKDADRSDFYFIPRSDAAVARETIVNLVAEHIPRSFGFDPIADVQVLAPVHRGELGTRALNLALQERLNPKVAGGQEATYGERAYRMGDKVMQIKNDYDRAVFNGDIGVVSHIAANGSSLQVAFSDGRAVRYQRDDLKQLMHAFAVTVHKSQGSEYPVVVLPFAMQHYVMLQRNLLYTALTRGKRLVVLVGSQQAVEQATSNRNVGVRWTWLAERIRAGTSIAR